MKKINIISTFLFAAITCLHAQCHTYDTSKVSIQTIIPAPDSTIVIAQIIVIEKGSTMQNPLTVRCTASYKIASNQIVYPNATEAALQGSEAWVQKNYPSW